jgi:glutamine synthetase adenylyltransferase
MKKEGSIRKRGNNVEIRISINGKQKSFYGKTEAEARKKIREYKNDIKVLNEQIKLEKGTIVFGEYVYNWLIKYKFQSLKRLIKWFDTINL